MKKRSEVAARERLESAAECKGTDSNLARQFADMRRTTCKKAAHQIPRNRCLDVALESHDVYISIFCADVWTRWPRTASCGA